VTVKGATTLSGRLATRYGDAIEDPSAAGLTLLYPEPASLERAPLERIGLPAARANALRAWARAACEGTIDFGPAPAPEAARRVLSSLPGIGPWTVEYLGMRGLSDPDAFPAGDLGLRKALAKEGSLASQREVEERGAAWSPWRAYAAMHLWASLNDAPGSAAESKTRAQRTSSSAIGRALRPAARSRR
jgi:AraC family transcriptional regulator of adaptative response / DNA-3-methyladenine glycosylase II